ncbi:MAG: hypothetical protein JWQ98_3346 [Chlorobi bacterium]|nr:hypothetical protein [Chlorobiota bacterium]
MNIHPDRMAEPAGMNRLRPIKPARLRAVIRAEAFNEHDTDG